MDAERTEKAPLVFCKESAMGRAEDACMKRVTAGVAVGGAVGGAVGALTRGYVLKSHITTSAIRYIYCTK